MDTLLRLSNDEYPRCHCEKISVANFRGNPKKMDCFDFLQKSRNDGNGFGLLWRFNESPRNDGVE